MNKLLLYLQLIRLDRPIGVLLLLWPTMWAIWIAASGKPDLIILTVFVAGVVLMRSAGCAINDFADREVDPFVERTKNRPLATGAIPAYMAVVVFALLSLIALALALLFLNKFTIQLALVAVVLATMYPFMKRYTNLPQVWLGAAFAWAIPMAFAALTDSLPMGVWFLFFANLCWTVAYDTIYAMADREDDLKIGVKSTAILFAGYDRLIIGLFQLATIILLVISGRVFELGFAFYLSLFGASLLMLYHQWLIREREPKACFQAFLNNHWVGAVVFVGIAVNYF